MSVASDSNAIRQGRAARAFIYLMITLFALFYLLPLFVMSINSVKPLAEITGGNMIIPMLSRTEETTMSIIRKGRNSRNPISKAVFTSLSMKAGITT